MRITFKEANYIMRRKQSHRLEQLSCYWEIQLQNSNSGYIRCWMKWWIYILLFIPIHLLKFLWCLWDGGIKEFCIEPRKIQSYAVSGLTNDGEETEFGRFKKVWEKYEANS